MHTTPAPQLGNYAQSAYIREARLTLGNFFTPRGDMQAPQLFFHVREWWQR